jgi:hypothetical protein
MRRKLVRRLTEARAFQNILGIGGAQYLRLVWATSVITEPPNIYEAIEPHLPLTADVPKIPRVAGEGIVRLAAMSGRPLIAVALASSRRVELNTWDHAALNLPFSSIALVGGPPNQVPSDADAATLERYRVKLEADLNAATNRAYALAETL